MQLRTLLGLVAFSCAAHAVAPKLPALDFARWPALSDLQFSPDGKYIGYLCSVDGYQEMSFIDLDSKRSEYAAPGRSMHGGPFTWVSDRRVVFRTSAWQHYTGGLYAVDRDAAGWTGLTGFARWNSHLRGGIWDGDIIYSDQTDPHHILVSEWRRHPDVYAIDTLNGETFSVVVNPGNVEQWLADWNGSVRFGLIPNGTAYKLTYRDSDKSPWQDVTIHTARDGYDRFRLLGLDANNETLYLSHPDQNRRWSLYAFDLKTKHLSAPQFAHKEYDALPDKFVPFYAGACLSQAIFSQKTHTLLGVRFMAEYPSTYWFDAGMQQLQKDIDALHPDLVNLIVSRDRTEEQALVLSFSAREPGIYTIVNLRTHKATEFGRSMPWINAADMAETYPIKCKARDGLLLHGYLTLPQGLGQKNLPMVVLVHGGPFARDSWGFDPEVQFLANRGYAVLQVNFRGSTGYGQGFLEKGWHEIGAKIQDDITDAVKWAIAKGVADPHRIAIMGGSYGGFSVLWGLAHTPELYRCGIDFAGVTDWPALTEITKHEEKDDVYREAHRYWIEELGDIDNPADLKRLQQVSPVNFADQIKAPLLIVHGKDDRQVPFEQSTTMEAALTKAGHKPETLYLDGLAHQMPREANGEKYLTAIEKFLATHLAAE